MNHRLKKFLLFSLADSILLISAMFLAFILRFDGQIPVEYQARLFSYALLSIGISLPIFVISGLYAFTWAYVSIYEIIKLLTATLFSLLAFVGIYFFAQSTALFDRFPRSIIILHYGIAFLLIGLLRAGKRILRSLPRGQKNESIVKRAFMIGANESADLLIRTLQDNKNDLMIAGILEDIPTKHHTYLRGVRIIGAITDLPELAKRHQIQTVIIALPNVKSRVIRDIFQLANSVGIKDIRIVPSLLELLAGSFTMQQLRPIKVEDLLGREQAAIDTAEIKRFLRGMDVLITGAAGSIGSELCRQVSKFEPSSLHLLDYEESNLFDLAHSLRAEYPELKFNAVIADVRNEQKIHTVIKHIRPQVIFHAAAYKHVPFMEEFPDEATATNIFGTLFVARAAVAADVEKFVLISSDKAVRPVSVMGQTKKIAEMIIQSMNDSGKTQFVAVRFGNVLGSRGSVIPLFEKQIQRGGPITITDPKMTRFFMTAPEAVLLVMQASAIGNGGKLFILDMGEPVKIIDLARELIRLHGLEPEKDIKIVTIGARPGEKIFEEVLTAEEGTAATEHQKIFCAKTNCVMSSHELLSALEDLKTYLTSPDDLRQRIAQLTNTSQPTQTLSTFENLRASPELKSGTFLERFINRAPRKI